MNTTKFSLKDWIPIICLVLAGEMIFSLPFHIPRFFRPTLLEAFELTNTELGDALSVYGITAMISYFPGGSLADRFPARKLISLSLFATGIGGFYFAQIPGKTGILILFAYWGITTIFLFWSAMIKATREWGGKFNQGKAFGILDGGRGLVAAGAASIAVLILNYVLTNYPNNDLDILRIRGIKSIIYLYSFFTIGISFLAWEFIPETKQTLGKTKSSLKKGLIKVLKSRRIWMQAVIVVCAYCGYKGLDYYSLYGTQVLNMGEVEAAKFVTNASYLRVIAAIGAGLIADRYSSTKVIRITFLLLIISYFVMFLIKSSNENTFIIMANLIFTFAAVYALRGIYFAMLEETQTQKIYTGTAVGIISFIGFTPDIFFNSIAGRILDKSPGLVGFQYFFLMLTIFAFIGLIFSILLNRLNKSLDYSG